MLDNSWFEKFWSFIKLLTLSVATSALTGIVGNTAYAYFMKHSSGSMNFSEFLYFLYIEPEINNLQIFLLVLFVFIGGLISTLIIRFRYIQALNKSLAFFNIKQDYLNLINNICSGNNNQSLVRIIQGYIDDIVSFYPRILGAAVFIPDSDNPQILNYIGKQGITLKNLSGDKYYPFSENCEERGAVGEAFKRKEHIIVNIKLKREKGITIYEADCPAYRFPSGDNTNDPGYKAMIAVPILTYDCEEQEESTCHGVISFYSKRKNIFKSDTGIANEIKDVNNNINSELGSLVNDLYVAKFLYDLTKD